MKTKHLRAKSIGAYARSAQDGSICDAMAEPHPCRKTNPGCDSHNLLLLLLYVVGQAYMQFYVVDFKRDCQFLLDTILLAAFAQARVG